MTYCNNFYHKSTYTGLLLNFKSFAPFEYKVRLIKTLLDKALLHKIWTSWSKNNENTCSSPSKIKGTGTSTDPYRAAINVVSDESNCGVAYVGGQVAVQMET